MCATLFQFYNTTLLFYTTEVFLALLNIVDTWFMWQLYNPFMHCLGTKNLVCINNMFVVSLLEELITICTSILWQNSSLNNIYKVTFEHWIWSLLMRFGTHGVYHFFLLNLPSWNTIVEHIIGLIYLLWFIY